MDTPRKCEGPHNGEISFLAKVGVKKKPLPETREPSDLAQLQPGFWHRIAPINRLIFESRGDIGRILQPFRVPKKPAQSSRPSHCVVYGVDLPAGLSKALA